MTEDEADNQMVEYNTNAPRCCGGTMVREENSSVNDDLGDCL